MSWHVIDAANQRLADVATYLLECLVSATDRDTLEFLCLGAPREILAVIRSLDHDGILSDATPGASETVGGGSGTPCPAAPASGDGQRTRNTADLPAADIVATIPQRTTYASRVRMADISRCGYHRCSLCDEVVG